MVSCFSKHEPANERPEDLITTDALIPIIVDLQILESHYMRKFQRPNMFKKALDSASYFVFESHGVTEDRFERSYAFYSADVQSMYQIYEATLDSINLRVSGGIEEEVPPAAE